MKKNNYTEQTRRVFVAGTNPRKGSIKQAIMSQFPAFQMVDLLNKEDVDGTNRDSWEAHTTDEGVPGFWITLKFRLPEEKKVTVAVDDRVRPRDKALPIETKVRRGK